MNLIWSIKRFWLTALWFYAAKDLSRFGSNRPRAPLNSIKLVNWTNWTHCRYDHHCYLHSSSRRCLFLNSLIKLLKNESLDWWNDPSRESFITSFGSLSFIFILLKHLSLGKNYTNYFLVCHLPRCLWIQLFLVLILSF